MLWSSATPVKVLNIAHTKQTTLWRSAVGRLFLTEKEAFAHKLVNVGCASCGSVISCSWSLCDLCAAKKEREAYAGLPAIEWDGATPICSRALMLGIVFAGGSVEAPFEWFPLDDTEAGMALADALQMVACEPVYMKELSGEYITEDAAWSAPLPTEISEALDTLNAAIRKQPPISWIPGRKTRIVFK